MDIFLFYLDNSTSQWDVLGWVIPLACSLGSVPRTWTGALFQYSSVTFAFRKAKC